MKKIRENYLEFVASFLIVLIVTIPLYVADVYANIESVSVKGSDGIEAYARPSDFLNFKVKASINGTKIAPEQVILGSDYKFQKCASGVEGSYECTLRFPATGNDDFEARSLSYTINLFDENGTLDDSVTDEFTIDNKPPEVTVSATKDKYSSKENVTINYEITDFACDDDLCSGKCSGIKDVEFSSSDKSFSQKVDVSTSDCSYSGSISIESTKFSDGLNSIYAKATDNFKKVSTESGATFEIDNTGPSIASGSFEITRNGASLSAFSTKKLPVTISINITAEDLDTTNVAADLSALNPAADSKSAKASCSASGSADYVCKWNINLALSKEGLKSIIVGASDTSGNRVNATLSRDLTLDDTGPKVLSLVTAQIAADKVFAKLAGNTVTAEFDESTGLEADDVVLHASGASIKPTSCTKDTNWICTWENVAFTKKDPVMSIENDTVDILGNSVPKELSINLTIDDEPPILNRLNVTNVAGSTQAFPGLFKIGDKIGVIANLSEENELIATADFSKFVTDAENVKGTCEKIDDNQICIWTSDAINLAGSNMITFNFSDNAGNTLIVTKSLKVFGIVNETVPDLWINNVTCSPRTIDRQLGPFINQKEFCQVKLIPKVKKKELSTIYIGPATCSGDTSIIDDVSTSNVEKGSTSPLIEIKMKKDDFKINSVNLTCSFDIFSKFDGKITQNPEIENAHIDIVFSNLPLGEVSEEVQRKIKDAKDDAKGIWDIIGVLNKIVYYAKKICQLINTFYNIVGVLYTVAVYFGLLDATLGKTYFGIAITPTAVATCGTETTARYSAQGTYQILNRFCAYVNCKNTILWGPTVANWINNQPLLSPSSLLGTETKVEGNTWYNQEVKLKNEPAGPLSNYIKPATEYMDPNKNLLVAVLFACLPGIIYGLDKYRQIKCLYADCLQNAVGKEGLPIKACEDQKAFATCKYITTELFALFPWTAMFDHYMNLIKNAMSNPFAILGVGISLACGYTCSIPEGASRTAAFTACEFARYVNQLGSIVQDVKGIIDEGFQIRTDYCERLKDDEKK